jgi:hypothetical protein
MAFVTLRVKGRREREEGLGECLIGAAAKHRGASAGHDSGRRRSCRRVQGAGLDGVPRLARPSEHSRQRVLDAAEKLGRRPNRSAALILLRRSHLIGVMAHIRNTFHAELVKYVVAQPDGFGKLMVLGASGLTPVRRSDGSGDGRVGVCGPGIIRAQRTSAGQPRPGDAHRRCTCARRQEFAPISRRRARRPRSGDRRSPACFEAPLECDWGRTGSGDRSATRSPPYSQPSRAPEATGTTAPPRVHRR